MSALVSRALFHQAFPPSDVRSPLSSSFIFPDSVQMDYDTVYTYELIDSAAALPGALLDPWLDDPSTAS